MPEEPKSFWRTIPGIITAIATLITAIGGFLVVLHQVGVFGSKPEPKPDAQHVSTGIAGQSQLEGLTTTDMKARQMELELRLREMEQRLAQPSDRSTIEPSESQPFQHNASLAGRWYFDNGAYWNIMQQGVSIAMQEISSLSGLEILTAGGQGTVIGTKAFIEVSSIDGGSGNVELSVSPDGRMLSGVLKDLAGNTLMSLVLTRSTD